MEWAQTNLPSLADLEAQLQCGICHDLMDTPVDLTTCGHTFCSRCVREALTIKSEVSTIEQNACLNEEQGELTFSGADGANVESVL